MSRMPKKQYAFMPFLMIFVGTGMAALGITAFYDPMSMVTGGFSGLAILIKALTSGLIEGGIPLWVTNLVLNIPVFILSYIFIGKKFVGKTLFGAGMLTIWLAILPSLDFTSGDYLLTAIFGPILTGAGIGITIRGGATTGGTDMVAALIQLKMKYRSVAEIMQVLDAAIVVAGILQFGLYQGMYALIAIFVTSRVSDLMVEGPKFSKSAYIISDHPDEVAKKLMEEVDRGVTGIRSVGMYTREEREMIYIVVSKNQIVKVKEVVNQVDPEAFIIVSDVHEVLGNGFQKNAGTFD